MTTCLRLGLASLALAAFAGAAGAEPVSHAVSATSTADIELRPDGGWKIATRWTRFEAYAAVPDVLLHATFPPRLATITKAATQDGDEGTSRIEVAVDDMSGPVLKRLAAFSDPGAEGKILGGLYFVTTEPGCCALPSRHHVRALETGKLLFGATGGGEVGIAAWMQVPNASPTIERWAAFEGAVGRPGRERDPARLGDLLYGDRRGILSRAVLRAKAVTGKPAGDADELDLDAATCGFLLWVEPGRPRGPGRARRPDTGCGPGGSYAPDSLFSLDRRIVATALGGFEIEFSIGGRVHATIPIANDRLDVAHARVSDRVSVAAAREP